MISLAARLLRKALLLLLGAVLAMPVLAVFGSWAAWNGESAGILREMAATVLPTYALTSIELALMVAAGTGIVGAATAAAVTLFLFPGRKTFEWLLLLPLAMPAYVAAYAYTDFLQFTGPFQDGLRALTGLEGRVFPEIRSLGGATLVFIFSLYPYVYLITRSALADRAAHLMEAAQMMGASPARRLTQVVMPLARPAIAAGVALVMMETLADFGVTSYFGIQTFTTGIYKAWLSMDNRVAAAQLATFLLAVVSLVLWLERRAQSGMRFAAARGARAGSMQAQPIQLRRGHCVAVWAVCLLPVLLGFVLPVVFMLRPLLADSYAVPWGRFLQWAGNSLRLGLLSAIVAISIAFFLAFLLRRSPDVLTRGVVQLGALGYAVPGAVIVVGLLLPIGWLQAAAPSLGFAAVFLTTSAGLLWAYLVRFNAVALQTLQSGYARIPASIDDAARTLGARAPRLLLRVHAPLMSRTTIAAMLLVFVDVMKELPATMVLRPFNSDTLAVITYQLARDERLGEAALPSLALVLVGLLPVILLSRAIRAPDRQPGASGASATPTLKPLSSSAR